MKKKENWPISWHLSTNFHFLFKRHANHHWLYINMKLLQKWTFDLKKSHFPILVLKYVCTPIARFSFSTVFIWPKNRVKGGLPVFGFWFLVSGWRNETNHNQGQWTGRFLHILWRADSPRISFWCRHRNTNPLEIYISEKKKKKTGYQYLTIWREKSPKK